MASFEALSPYDFEVLVQDLIGADRRIRLESFAVGRDSGIDLRHLATGKASGLLVAQCKHYEKTGYSGLLSHMKKEAVKAAALKAQTYILATTVSLTPARKDELAAVLKDVAPEVEVMGREGIETLLREYPKVEQSHYKLWLNSTAVLDKVLNNGILMRTQGVLENLREKAAIFVTHKGVAAAEEILRGGRVLIITVAPGVGKSTLADILLMTLVADDFEPVIVSRDIDDADQMYRISEKQVFYYDDFLGRTSITEKLRGNEDNRLTNFIRRVQRSQNKYLIMTTRQHIIEQARRIYDRLDDPSVNVSRYLLDLTAYTRNERAHILYNHVYFSALSAEHRKRIVKDKTYLRLIDSANFNPRLVELTINLAVLQAVPAKKVGAFLTRAFDNPRALWQHVMENQLTLAQKWILAYLALDIDWTSNQLSSLERQYYTTDFGMDARRSLEEELRTLEGVTVRITDTNHGVNVRLSNPGVADAVKEFVLSQSSLFDTLLPTLSTWDQALSLWNAAFERAGEVSWLTRYGQSATGQSHGLLPPIDINDAKRPGLFALIQSRKREFVEMMARCACDSRRRLASAYYSDKLEGRVSTLIEILPGLVQEDIGAFLTEAVSRVQSAWEEGHGDKRATVDLIVAVVKSPLLESSAMSVLLAAGQKFLQDASNSDPNDYVAMHYLGSGAVDLPADVEHPSPEEIERDFLDFVESKVNDLEAEDLSRVRGELEELESIARLMDVPIDYELTDIWKRVEQAERESDQEDYDPTEHPTADGSEDDGDEFADDLFASLV